MLLSDFRIEKELRIITRCGLRQRAIAPDRIGVAVRLAVPFVYAGTLRQESAHDRN
ncbi:hypothetical protein [Herbaspirillum sp. RV1423]|uniref:hypothetical protein n=1 Tax=Herbaspirillum sp. RV1423 TaxID=1443993 RepID=UPI0018CC43B8|nr:hypothetical protein [Herbaspirillum sp. RV1423]